jgi:hypothetical protein
MRRLPDGRRRIDAIAERVVDLALSGDAEMIQLIFNRMSLEGFVSNRIKRFNTSKQDAKNTQRNP